MKYRKYRKELIDRCIKVIRENNVRTQEEFSAYYYEECMRELSEIKEKSKGKSKQTKVLGGETMNPSQSTVNRWLHYAHVYLSSMTGCYTVSTEKSHKERARDSVKFILQEHANEYEKISENEFVIEIDSGYEQHVARGIQDYLDGSSYEITYMLDKILIKFDNNSNRMIDSLEELLDEIYQE